MEEGIEEELEHRDLITRLLKEAGKDATEDEIKAVAAEIARVHLSDDPEYYRKRK